MLSILKTSKASIFELLTVTAILSVLSGIVLVTINLAQHKAKDAMVKTSLIQFRTQVEIESNLERGSYYASSFIDSPMIMSASKNSSDFAVVDFDDGFRRDEIKQWRAYAPLSILDDQSYCVDSAGFSGVVSTKTIIEKENSCFSTLSIRRL